MSPAVIQGLLAILAALVGTIVALVCVQWAGYSWHTGRLHAEARYQGRVARDRVNRKPNRTDTQVMPTQIGDDGALCVVGHWIPPDALQLCDLGHAVNWTRTHLAPPEDIATARRAHWAKQSEEISR